MTDAAEHYSIGAPYQRVMSTLDVIAPSGAPVTLDDLGGFDEFHTGGRLTTTILADLTQPTASDIVLDAGSGVGGPARYLADRFGCRVIGVDATPEFVTLAQELNVRTGLTHLVSMRVGDVTALDLDRDSVDVVWQQHVGMNVREKAAMYREFARVLRPGGRFALFDIVAGSGDLHYPLPWAATPDGSHLVTATELRSLIEDAGFEPRSWEEPDAARLVATRSAVERMLASPPDGSTLGMHSYLADMPLRVATYLRNLEEGRAGLVMTLAVLR